MILLGGATATGKSAVAAALARVLNGELVSADSMQVYCEMNIGTAKESDAALGVRQHVIDVVRPDEPFSVVNWHALAVQAIRDIAERGKVPIVVGGTGLYLSSLMYRHTYGGDRGCNREIRQKWKEYAESAGKEALWRELERRDSAAAQAIHPNNVKRVIRALEVCEGTGRPFSEQNDAKQLEEGVSCFCLTLPRDLLYARIEQRVDKMIAGGLEREVRGLASRYSFQLQSMQGIGYKEWQGYLQGDGTTLANVRDAIVQNTRHYAKRQETWLRSYGGDMMALDGTKPEFALKKIVDYYKNRY